MQQPLAHRATYSPQTAPAPTSGSVSGFGGSGFLPRHGECGDEYLGWHMDPQAYAERPHTPTCEQQPCRQLATPAPQEPPRVESGSAASVAVGVTATSFALGRPRSWSDAERVADWPKESLETVALRSGLAATAAEAFRSLAVRRAPCGR